MSDLRATFCTLGYGDVQTVLQSGNVVFSSPAALVSDATSQAESAIHRQIGVQASVLLIAAEEFIDVARENPLIAMATDLSRLLVTFMAEPPDRSRIEEPDAASLAPEVLRVGTRAIYQWFPEGVLASRVPAAFWKQIDSPVTARNWRTVLRLMDVIELRAQRL